MNKICAHKNLIIKTFGIIIAIVAIPVFLLSVVALQGSSTLPDLSMMASNFYISFYFLGTAVNIISVPLILIGYIKNYKFNWINYSLFVPIVLNGFLTFSILTGIIRGDFYIPIILALPSIIYIIAWLVYKNNKSSQDLRFYKI